MKRNKVDGCSWNLPMQASEKPGAASVEVAPGLLPSDCVFLEAVAVQLRVRLTKACCFVQEKN